MLDTYIEQQFRYTEAALFAAHPLTNLRQMLDQILRRAEEYLKLEKLLARAGLSMKVRIVHSIRERSISLIPETKGAATIVLDYAEHGDFIDFVWDGPTMSRALHVLATESYLSSRFELALRFMLASTSNLLNTPPSARRESPVPRYGEDFLAGLLVGHEVGHVYHHAERETQNLARSSELAMRNLAAARVAMRDVLTCSMWRFFTLPPSILSLLDKATSTGIPDPGVPQCQEITADIYALLLSTASFHWGDTIEPHAGDALIGTVLVSAFAAWRQSLQRLTKTEATVLDSIEDIWEENRSRYRTTIWASAYGEETIRVSSAGAHAVAQFLEGLPPRERQSLDFQIIKEFFWGGPGSDTPDRSTLLPTPLFLAYCEAIYDAFGTTTRSLLRKIHARIHTRRFWTRLRRIEGKEQLAFEYLAGLEIERDALTDLLRALPVDDVSMPTFAPLIMSISRRKEREALKASLS